MINSRTLTNTESIALFNLFILLFFSFFGTSIPFQETDYAASFEAEGSNIINQIVYVFLFISSLLLIIQNPTNTFNFIRKEKYLAIFVIICLSSAIWSAYGFLSIKRSFQLLTCYLALINAVLFAPYRSIISVIKVVLSSYVVITIFVGFFVPQAIDADFGTWKGLAYNKNGLGQTGLMIFVLSLLFYGKDQGKFSRMFAYLISFLSAIIIFLAGSSTNIVGLGMVLLLLFIFSIEKIFKPSGTGRYITLIIIFFASCLTIILSLFAADIIALVPGIFGKDLSFTGRSDVWVYLWPEVEKNLWFGYGYSTYWVMGTSVLDRFQYYIGFKVNQAHNGYLEIMLQLGVFGFSLFLLFIVSFIKRAVRVDYKPAIIALVSVLVLNFTEGTIFQARGPTTLVICFFYLVVSYYFFHEDNIY